MSKVIVPESNKEIVGIKDDGSLSPSIEKREGAISIFSRLLRLDTLKRTGAVESPTTTTTTEPPTTYYGVYIPCEIKKGPDEEALHVYKEKCDALELVRKYKVARFKAFQNHQDAVSFALRGAEPNDVTDGVSNTLFGEKPYPFRAPSQQDMVTLRKAIEAGKTELVQEKVRDNPRYLVSSGNTPAILQEGSRYNALHIAAKAMNAEICNLILVTVGDPVFIHTLYGNDADPECCKEFATILVDRYLNTPDKAINETPLHFAAKFGAEDVVDLLTSFPQCNRRAVNKYGERPEDVICKRACNASAETAANIARLLHERYYVPVLHADDGSVPPAVGRPFTPDKLPDFNRDPLSPRYEIRAFAGPMEAGCADQFHKRWKTPPRSSTFRLREMTKGLETVGRDLADKMKVNWKEYWPFLDTFTDFRTPEGLQLLEDYLKEKYEIACSFKITPEESSQQEQSLSKLSTPSNFGNQSPVKEALSPVSELCMAMKSCVISKDRLVHWKKTDPIKQRLCRQPNPKLIQNHANGDGSIPPMNHTVSQLLCIERTCQVFAKRLADALIFSLAAEPEIAGDSLKAESKHFQHTMLTYMDDERFNNIDFGLIHSRLAQLAVFKLRQRTDDLDDVNRLVEFLVKLRCPNDDIFSSDDERKPTRASQSRAQMNRVIDTHVRCLASFISEELTDSDASKGPSLTESECVDIWRKVSKCGCEWRLELYERNSKRNASFRKNRSMLSTSPKNDSFIKRLSFDQGIGDGRPQEPQAQPSAPSVNSPAGDGSPPLPKDDDPIANELMSDDESNDSVSSDYQTASDRSGSESGEDDRMADASDRAIAEAFIYGEEPTKMDRLVYEAVRDCEMSAQTHPYLYRWRHTIALYTPHERELWPAAPLPGDSANATYSFSVCSTPRSRARGPADGTPRKEHSLEAPERPLTLQVSQWLRVTGPHSPRATLATRNIQHNASFGF
ncbi:Ankyrin repeat and LEM domain-containing protein 2 [Eumeta japonica]|uniref:Ankyrin repeat and LEM domain-containing protein 2 n=1 Tax=Eumeta variegata TaxID=151549 RepID=A0A4C1YSQ8_EUMVA|nr:Ankyrin repeat and LEM domain-containing protein 2 [Eumeta japonica]